MNPERLGLGWAMFAYRSWQRLSAVDRVLGARPAAAAVLQRPAHRDPARSDAAGRRTRGRCRCGAFVSPESLRWVLRHRAWTPYYLVRYWRFLRLQAAAPARRHRGLRLPRPGRRDQPPGGATAGSCSAAGCTSATAARCARTRARCGSATRPCSAARTPSTATSTSRSGRAASWPTGSTSATSTTGSTTCTCPIKDQGIVKSPVRIGADVWVGVKASVLRGAQVGDGCVLAAHTVVTRRGARRQRRRRRPGPGGAGPGASRLGRRRGAPGGAGRHGRASTSARRAQARPD